MITASMTSGEMRRVRNLDEARIYEFQMRKANELKRELRKQNVRQMTKTYELVTQNANYFIVVGVKQGGVFVSGVFIYLKETNEYIPMSRNEGYSEDCFAMSVHFLKRFAERFLNKELPIAKILQKIYTSFTGAVQLYSDDKTRRVVFAIPEGLILTEYEQEKHIIHYKTFVSMDMLKKTQMRSYEKISAFLMESCQQIAKARETGNDERLCVVYRRFYNDIDLLDTKEAQAYIQVSLKKEVTMKDKCITRFLGDIKPIKNYERYYVSKLGHVFTIGRTSQLKEIAPCKTPKGYLKVWLYKNGKRKMFYIHRLVAQAFLENPEALPMVNHKDFDKTNNDVDNLEYCTARYNVIYSAIAKKTSSEYLGVTWNKSVRKWQAQYQVGKKKTYIGCFGTQEEAHEAYVNAIKEI